MDALKFVKERKRMCKSQEACGGCPLERFHCIFSTSTSDEEDEKSIAAVEQWSKEHPRKTRQSVFLEQWPNAKVFVDGVLSFAHWNWINATRVDQQMLKCIVNLAAVNSG